MWEAAALKLFPRPADIYILQQRNDRQGYALLCFAARCPSRSFLSILHTFHGMELVLLVFISVFTHKSQCRNAEVTTSRAWMVYEWHFSKFWWLRRFFCPAPSTGSVKSYLELSRGASSSLTCGSSGAWPSATGLRPTVARRSGPLLRREVTAGDGRNSYFNRNFWLWKRKSKSASCYFESADNFLVILSTSS